MLAEAWRPASTSVTIKPCITGHASIREDLLIEGHHKLSYVDVAIVTAHPIDRSPTAGFQGNLNAMEQTACLCASKQLSFILLEKRVHVWAAPPSLSPLVVGLLSHMPVTCFAIHRRRWANTSLGARSSTCNFLIQSSFI